MQAIQVGATAALSMLCKTADRSKPYLSGNATFGLGAKQVELYFLNIIFSMIFHVSGYSK